MWRSLTIAMAIAAIGTIMATKVCNKDSSTIPHNLLSYSPLSFVSSFFSFYGEMLNMDGDLFLSLYIYADLFFPLQMFLFFIFLLFLPLSFPFFFLFANMNRPQRPIYQSFRYWLLWIVFSILVITVLLHAKYRNDKGCYHFITIIMKW